MEIRSPYSGRRVQVREHDVNRAVRDEEGRIFYLVQRSEGQGYYASSTRHGSAEEERKYLELEQRIAEEGEPAPVSGQEAKRVHDATGPGRPISSMRLIVVMTFLAAAALLVVLVGFFVIRWVNLPVPAPEGPTPEEMLPEDVDRGPEGRLPGYVPYDRLAMASGVWLEWRVDFEVQPVGRG